MCDEERIRYVEDCEEFAKFRRIRQPAHVTCVIFEL